MKTIQTKITYDLYDDVMLIIHSFVLHNIFFTKTRKKTHCCLFLIARITN